MRSRRRRCGCTPGRRSLPPAGGEPALAIEGEAGEDLRRELRRLIDRVDFIPLEGLGKFDLRVQGSLAALLGLGGGQNAENPTAGDRGASDQASPM